MKRIFSMLCVLALMLGMIAVPAYATDAEGAVQQNQVVLSADAENLTVEEDTYIDLNGYSIAGVTVKDGATLYVSDSKTDDYTVADGIYGKITDAQGAVEAAQGYVAINEDGLSYHKVDLTLTSMTLRPAVAGVYYNSAFAADEVVAANVECYGVALSVVAEPTAENLDTLCGYSTIYGFANGEKSGTLLTGIMNDGNTDFANDRNAAMDIYGRAYIKTAEGYTFGTTASRNLKEQVEAIDAIFSKLNEAQSTAILSMYSRFESVMENWNVPNMKHAAPLGDTVITVPVETEDGEVTETVTVEQDGVTITIPFGTLVDSNELTLTVTRLEASESEIEAGEGQTLMPFDVHVDGISAENTQPLTVALGKVMPENLNMGNYTVYHVEETGTNEMELVANAEELTDHNQYAYTLDGELTLNMATFSVVAAVTDNDNAWNGDRDYSWYTNAIDENANATDFEIRNADQLAGFGAIVGGMAKTADEVEIEQDSFAGKTVKLLADINIGDLYSENGIVFYPIGYNSNDGKYEKTGLAVSTGFYAFMGTFDGNGNTISNFYQNTWEMKGDHNWYDASLQYYRDGMGLFGKVYGGIVKNLTVNNFSCDGEIATTGVIAAYADCGATFENIAITKCNPRVYNIGNGGIVGCAGWYAKEDNSGKPITFKNITVDQTNKISALWGTYDVSCGGILGQYYPVSGQDDGYQNGGILFKDCHVAAIIDVNNDVCANYQYYWYRYSGMLMGTVRANKKDADGYTVADTTGIKAEGCTYTYGSWNEYWYCELVKNSSASYTHDYQFGRLTNIDDLSEIQSGETWLQEGNFALVSDDRKSVECYHIFKNSEGNLYRHFHDVADESNPEIYEDFDLDGNGQLDDLKEDRQRYYLPFGQVLNGLGYGVKPTYTFEGFTLVEDGTVISGPKFQLKDGADLSYEPGETVYLKDLVDLIVDESKLSQSSLYAAASPVNEEDTVTVTYSRDVEEWENNYITFSEDTLGAVKLVITDYFYCEPTVIYLNVGVAEPVEKFQATATTNVDAEKAVTLGELFTALPDVTIDHANVDITATGGTFEFVKNEADWTQSTVTFTETATYTVVITDADNCIPTERTVTVDPIDKFALVFENTDKYLYRVGNASGSTVALNLLFKALDGVTVSSADIAFTTVAGNASGTYTAKSPWTSGTIQFSGTGVVKVTITAANANPLTLNLEVVEAKNATTATSATSSNVVLLKDCGFSSLTVSGGYTLYGNGFTMTCASDSTASDMGYAFVTLTDGTLDNVQIDCPNFDYAALYKSNLTSSDNRSETDSSGKIRYYNAKSGVMASGNSQILNSRISGARAAVNVSGGNCVIDNSRIERGAVASILVGSANSLVLRDVTLIQEPTESTYKADGVTGTTIMGFSVLLICNSEGVATPVTLEGTLIQNAWADESDAAYVPSAGKSVVTEALKQDGYTHDLDGDGTKESLNLGFAYLPESTSSKVGGTTITDNRTDGVPYGDAEVSQTHVYSYQYEENESIPESFTNTPAYVPNRYSDIISVSYADTSTGLTVGKTYGASGWIYELNVDLDALSGYAFDFSKLSMNVNGVGIADYKVDGAEKPTSPIAVVAGGTTYTLTATVDGKEYTALYKVIGTETSKESPSLVASNYESALLVGEAGSTFSKDTWHGAAPVLNGVQIKYWSVAEKQYKTITLSDYTPTTAGKQNGTNAEWTYTGANNDFTLTIKNETAVHSNNGVYAMPVVFNSKLYFVASSSNGLVNYGNSARTIKINYYFKDNNGGTQLEFDYTWSIECANGNTCYDYSDFCDGTSKTFTIKSSNGEGCVTPDTLVTMADGTKKEIQYVSVGEEVLVWNFHTGAYEIVPLSLAQIDGMGELNVLHLYFEDGTELKVLGEHGIFDAELNTFIFIDEYDVESYLGHSFVKQDGNTYTTVKLVDYEITTENTTAYTVLSVEHYNVLLEDMFTVTPAHVGDNFFNPFEICDGMKYDPEKVKADIEKYGLYTYEDFAEYVTYEQFVALNLAQFKVSVGKGLVTYEGLVYLIKNFINR